MRRRTKVLAVTLIVLGSIGSTLAVGESIEKASQKDIAMLLGAASMMNSAYAATLIGEVEGRVFVEYRTGIYPSSFLSKGPKRVVYWFPRSEITEEQLTQFRTYKERFGRIGQEKRQP